MKENKPDHQSPSEIIHGLNFCVFDLETTGGNHKFDKIIEIGLVKIKNLEITERKNFLINPQMKIPEFIQKLTSISQNDVKDAPLIEDVVDEILEFMGDSVLVAHNTQFDVPFFNSVLKRIGREPLDNKSICTNLMTKYLIPNLLNSNLNYMSKIFKIDHEKAHRALDDAEATAELLINYLRIFINKGINKVNHLYYPRNRYELDRYHFKSPNEVDLIIKKIQEMKSSFLLSIKGENGIILFALPCENLKGSEIEFVKEKLLALPWKTTTIRLYGPLIEAIVHFNNLFPKIDSETRDEIMEHLNHKYVTARPSAEEKGDLNNFAKDLGDFVVANHLVPEQMVIFPISSLNEKNQLIYRYPGHRKKLLQYINSKSNRITNNKLKRMPMHPQVKNFIENYLWSVKKSRGMLFVFDKKLAIKRPEEFIKKLDQFLVENPNPHNYPSEYI